MRDEGTFGLGHTKDGDQQFSHDRNECDFGVLAPCTELLIAGPEPGIKTGCGQRRHPERGSEAKRGGSGILRQHAGGQASIQIRDMSRELRKAEIH